MNHLNPQQKQAVQEINVPCLVLAGAGSGKTKVIIEKIKFLLQQLPSSQKIAAVTFTNKASKEMQQRLQGDVSQGDVSEQKKIIKERTWIGTFHQLGIQILRHSGHFINLKSSFSILDQEDAISLLTEITLDKTLARQSLQHISHWKNKNLSPEEVAEHHDYQSKEWNSFIKVYDKYQKTLISYQAVDFDDLLRLPVTIFKNHQIALDYWGRQFAYFLVDEYQDTNPVQYLLLQYLTKNHQSFTVVGDDDQAIYGWRGASVEHLFQLIKDYHQLKTIKLEQNYRSTNAILYTANGVISCNPKPDESLHKQIWSALGQGTLPTVSSFPNSMIEAETVVRHLLQHQTHHRTKLGDYAILYRNNQQARVIEQQLRQHQIAYQISGGDSFFDKAEIRDVLAWLKLILNDDDDLAFIRAITHPKRGIGNSTLQYLSDYAQKNEQSLYASVFELGCAQYLQEKGLRKQYDVLHEFVLFISKMQHRANYEPASQVLPDLFSAINFEEEIKRIYDEKVAEKKCANVQDLYQWLLKKTNFNSNLVNKTSNNISNNDGHDEYDEVNLLKIIQSLNILTLLEQQEAKNVDQLVRLSTIHAAKGLEFNHVFLIGAEEGVLPSTPREPNADLEEFIIEERRLMYVAITRAKFNLWISWNQAPSNPWDQEKKGENPSSKNSSNSVSGANNILKANQPSRFIKEMKLEEFKTNMMDLSHKLANAGLIDVSEINAYQQKENIKQQSIQEMEQKSDIREKLAFLRQQLKG